MKKFIIILACLFLFPLQSLAENINVAFTIDNNYPIFTLLVINSILQNNNSDSNYTFYIVEDNLSSKNKTKMQEYVTKRNQNIEFINIDTKIIDDGNFFFGFSNRITPIAMARILLPKILPQNVHRVIYIDGDTLVLEDLKTLFEFDLKGKPFGMGVNITAYDEVSNFKINGNYYNSGVILMDLDKCRKDAVSDKLLNFVKEHKKLFLYSDDFQDAFRYPDQDLINIVMDGNIEEIPRKWNNQHIYGTSIEDISCKGIAHYIGAEKPWSSLTIKNTQNNFIKEYYNYWNKSGLRRYKIYYGFLSLKSMYMDIFNYNAKPVLDNLMTIIKNKIQSIG